MDFYLDELRQAFYNIASNMLENLENLKAKGEELQKQQDQGEHRIEEDDKNNRQGIQVTVRCDQQLLQIESDWAEFLQKIDFSDQVSDIKEIVGKTNPKEKNLSVESLLKSYERLCNLYIRIMSEKIENIDELKHADSLGIVFDQDRQDKDGKNLVRFTIKSPKSLRVEFSFKKDTNSNLCELNVYQFIDCAMETWNKILMFGLNPTPNEYFMINLAYRILRRSPGGTSLSQRCRYMGVPGFHPHTQTYMSLTDPGPGHLSGTVTQLRWMYRGVIMHLEHLERTTENKEREPTRDEIESYRIPSIKWFSMTRLHVGDIAPQTLYIGRRLKDSGDFDNDLLRVSRIFSACLNNMFNSGTSECKLSMEYLSTYEALKHMRSIRAEVTRNPYQILSAAWNLNRILKDDYPLALLKSYFGRKYELIEKLKFKRGTTAIERSDRFEIGKMAIAYTKLGGFDKVTWDGASDTYPSRCIVPYQLTLPQLFELNHIAHSLGLITYVSAGFKLDGIKIAVYSGVDGVGIGGAQVLRLMNQKTKVHGAYQQEHIDGILEKRDDAAKSLYGKCVNLMCRLDSMYYEGSLSQQEKKHRDNLFRYLNERYSRIEVFEDKLAPDYQNMLTEDNADLRNILNTLADITKLNTTMNNESDRTIYLDRFKRVLRNFDTALIRNSFLKDTDPQLLRGEIQQIVDNNVEQAAYDYWISYPWSDIIGDYQKNLLKEFITSSFN